MSGRTQELHEWYRWPEQAPAQAALDYINNHPSLPHVGMCKGKPAPDKQMTTKWADELTECTDGWWGFPRVSNAWLDRINVSPTERTQFLNHFVLGQEGAVQEFDPDWIPEAEEDTV
jgi:hypothetical protein